MSRTERLRHLTTRHLRLATALQDAWQVCGPHTWSNDPNHALLIVRAARLARLHAMCSVAMQQLHIRTARAM